jgi:tetratricopeptide (TPR) repeat protein
VCLRNRADIDEAEKNWGGAAYWYARAVAQAPSIPLGYWEWGRMLMGKGDLDGAIAKFQQANEKGPHFADPLEMWGEALMLKNHSDLALAKFEEANNYAPNWGRLHLKWGEALLYAGDKAGAAKQFAIARGFDLTASERSELARMRGAHG